MRALHSPSPQVHCGFRLLAVLLMLSVTPALSARQDRALASEISTAEATSGAQDGCSTLWELIDGHQDYSLYAAALQATNVADVLDSPQASLTALCPTNTVIEDTAARFGLTPEDLATNATDNVALWSFHVVDDVFYFSDIERLGDKAFPTLLQGKSLWFNYRTSSSNVYVSSYGSVSLLRTFLTEEGDSPSICSGQLYRLDAIMLPDMG